jgi:hypothetical protein
MAGDDQDRSFQNNLKRVKKWMSEVPRANHYNTRNGIFDILDVIEQMISPDPEDRPIIRSVCSSLYLFDDPAYFGDCCANSQYEEPVEKFQGWFFVTVRILC